MLLQIKQLIDAKLYASVVTLTIQDNVKNGNQNPSSQLSGMNINHVFHETNI